jgi:hypothetical protein
MMDLQMLQEGLAMGARGDGRITPEGVVSIVDELDSELGVYLDFAAKRQSFLSRRSSAAQGPQ